MPSDRTRPYNLRSNKRSTTTTGISTKASNNMASVGGGLYRAASLPKQTTTSPTTTLIPHPTPSTNEDNDDNDNDDRDVPDNYENIQHVDDNNNYDDDDGGDHDDEDDTDEDDEQARLVYNHKHSPHKDSPINDYVPRPSPVDENNGLGLPPTTVSPALTRQLTRLTGPIQVQTNLQIFRVHKIDSSSEEYTIDCGITFLWKDPFLAVQAQGKYFASHPAVVRHNPRTGRSDYELWPDNFIVGQTVFDPAWKIMNCSDLEVIKNFTTILNSGEGVVHNYLHIRATIYQTLDLHSFPFDFQEMTIRIQSEHSTQVVQFVPMPDRSPRLYDSNIASEWNIHCDSMKLHFDMDNRPAASGVTYAAMKCTFSATRRAEWYIYNVFTISYTIVFSSFSIFFVPSENTAERLSILFTTWLMLISLKFIISDRLPKISYLTTLDKYLHSSYLVMIILIINVCAVQMKSSSSWWHSNNSVTLSHESILGVGLFLSWTLMNLYVLKPIIVSYFK